MTSGLVMRGTCNQTDDLMRGLMTRISLSLHQPVVTPYSSQVPCRSGLKRLYCKLIRIKAKHRFLSRGRDFGAGCVQRVAQERATFSTGEGLQRRARSGSAGRWSRECGGNPRQLRLQSPSVALNAESGDIAFSGWHVLQGPECGLGDVRTRCEQGVFIPRSQGNIELVERK